MHRLVQRARGHHAQLAVGRGVVQRGAERVAERRQGHLVPRLQRALPGEVQPQLADLRSTDHQRAAGEVARPVRVGGAGDGRLNHLAGVVRGVPVAGAVQPEHLDLDSLRGEQQVGALDPGRRHAALVQLVECPGGRGERLPGAPFDADPQPVRVGLLQQPHRRWQQDQPPRVDPHQRDDRQTDHDVAHEHQGLAEQAAGERRGERQPVAHQDGQRGQREGAHDVDQGTECQDAGQGRGQRRIVRLGQRGDQPGRGPGTDTEQRGDVHQRVQRHDAHAVAER